MGLAQVEYISDTSQQAALQRLLDGFQQADIPFVEIALPIRKPASEHVRFLRERLAQIESGVVSITGFAHAFPDDTPLLESLRVLNYNRENLADFPLRQICWMPRDFTQMFRLSIPDLNSWFIVKLRLDEIIAPPDLAPRPMINMVPLIMGHEEGVNASNFYATRFRTALHRQIPTDTLWRLWIDAVRPLIDVGRTNEAIHLQDALLQEASENGIEMLGYLNTEDPTPELLNNVGLVYYKEERLAQAEPLYARALAIYRATLSPEHLTVGNSLNNLALLYASQGRYNEAELLFQEALAMRRNALPPGHFEIANSLNSLAAFYESQGRYAEAEPLQKEALTILHRALPVGHRYIAIGLSNLAAIYEHQGRYAEADPLFYEALAILYTALGIQHPETQMSFRNLISFLKKQGRDNDIAELLKHYGVKLQEQRTD